MGLHAAALGEALVAVWAGIRLLSSMHSHVYVHSALDDLSLTQGTRDHGAPSGCHPFTIVVNTHVLLHSVVVCEQLFTFGARELFGPNTFLRYCGLSWEKNMIIIFNTLV